MQLLASGDPYAGLQCIRWERTNALTTITLFNFDGACGAEWTGQASTEGSRVDLHLINPQCMIASCGTCMYDWSFELSSLPPDADSIRVVVDPCPGEQTPQTETVALPLSDEASGERCRYANAGGLGWQAMALGTCGTDYMPCRQGGMCEPQQGQSECDNGLVCADGAAAGEAICHASCETDDDCKSHATMKCDEGLCRPGGW